LRVYLEKAAGAEILTLRMTLETCSFSKAVRKSNNKHFVLFTYIDSFSLRLETEEWISDRPSAADCEVAGAVCVCSADGQKIIEIFLFFPRGLRPFFLGLSSRLDFITLRTGDADLRFYITTVQDG